MKKVIIGYSSKEGELYGDYEKCKACNFCVHFMGYGLHWCAGKCLVTGEEISGGYTGNYSKVAKNCSSFEYRPELIREV